MATIAPTIASVPARSWRDSFKFTRTTLYAIFFLTFGILLLIAGAGTAADVNTQLTFERAEVGENAAAPTITPLLVPTQITAIGIGILYIAGGALALIPDARLKRVGTIALIINGLLLIPIVLILAAAGASTNVTTMMAVSLRLATPIVLGALAGIWCERSGVTNIAIEGMMLTGACFGFVALALLAPMMGTGQAQLIGIVIAVVTGGIMSMLHAWLSITFKINQIVSGTVINILAVGITSFMRREVLLSSEGGRETLQPFPIPGLSEVPIVGDVFFNGRPIFYGMFALLLVTHVVLFYTRWGLRTRAVGENPRAADTLGIKVNRNRWINVIIGGLIAGLAGAWFSLETTGSFDDNMTSGRGFIALAAMIFGKWTPIGAFGGGLLFGFSDALGQRFQFLGVPIPSQFLQMVPYVITIIVLAGLVGRAVAPKADGIPYEKEGK
ncbi:MAG: ABC transporter permease [Chloroflexota bacterium]|nr:ABC transporter permease [Chloroflexota bacterium]